MDRVMAMFMAVFLVFLTAFSDSLEDVVDDSDEVVSFLVLFLLFSVGFSVAVFASFVSLESSSVNGPSLAVMSMCSSVIMNNNALNYLFCCAYLIVSNAYFVTY